MVDTLKTLIFFSLFIFICEISGLAILRKLKIDNDIIAVPIGIVLFECLFELLILPIQYFFLDTIFLKIVLVVALFVLLFFGRKEIKNIPKKIRKRDIYLLLIIIVLALIKILDLDIYGINYEIDDNLFYIPFINGVSMDGIAVNSSVANVFNAGNISSTYAFYGHMHLLGTISNLLNVPTMIIINFFQVLFITIFYITNVFNIYVLCTDNNIFSNINKYLVPIFIGVYLISAISSNVTIGVDTTTITFIVITLICYLKTKNKSWLLLFSMFSFQAMMIRSTYIFVIAFLLLPYYLYLFINNEFEVKENVYISIPVFLFYFFFVAYGHERNILELLLILLAIVLLLPIIVKKIGIKITKILYFAVIGAMFIYFIISSISIGDIVTTWDGFTINEVLFNNFLNFSSINNSISSITHSLYLSLGLLVLIMSIIKKKRISYVGLHIVTIFLLCLNQFVAPYIVKNMLSEVYYRLFWVWFNPLYLLIIVDEAIELLPYKKIVSTCLIVILLFSNIAKESISFINYSRETIKGFIDQRKEISLYYKVGKDSYEIGKAIDDYAKDNNMQFVYVAFPLNIINISFMSKHFRLSDIMGHYGSINRYILSDYFTQMWNEDKYEYAIYFYLSEPWRYFDDWKFENDIDKVPKLDKMFKDGNTDIFIMTKWDNREETGFHLYDYLTSFATIIYENDRYQVFVID